MVSNLQFYVVSPIIDVYWSVIVFLFILFTQKIQNITNIAYYYETKEIVFISNHSEVDGSGMIFYVIVDTVDYVQFWIKENEELAPYKVLVSQCSFHETLPREEKAYVEIGINKSTKQEVEYKIYLPEGTVNREYNLN